MNLADRRSDLLTREIEGLRAAVRKMRARLPFHIDAWVVLPDHLHCMWTLPEGDSDFSGRWRAIKTAFSKSVPVGEARSASRISKGERGIWQLRFWEHTIYDDRDYGLHMDYIHFNPVRHGFVANAGDWPFSSFHRCFAAGIYPGGWGGGAQVDMEAGERGAVGAGRDG